ncbi:MAG: phosphoenolpyruvate--protein phosphotransferase [Spirochaetaceae bacterium]|jgi:phosphotransferase system enzyme I (PtsI)|nr:phosphoenolpyruvate--protein phosphotransferase [Spirochaetaceae bacterium]
MTALQGKGVSAGVARGKVVFLERGGCAVKKKLVNDAADEVKRLRAALKTAAAQLDALEAEAEAKLGREQALLFEVHRMMLEDDDFIDPIVAMIETELVCAEYATDAASARLARDFTEMNDEYMSARAADVKDVARRVVEVLSGGGRSDACAAACAAACGGGEPAILASDDFSPSETAQLDRSFVLALASQAGSANSHTAIFARTMGIPAVIGLGEALAAGLAGKEAVLDGESGVLCIEPDEKTLAAFLQKKNLLAEETARLERFRGKETRTRDGRRIRLYANIGSVADVDAALSGDAEGIGLFRSEFLYLGREDFPDEDVQYESYKSAACKMNGKPVVIRTLDIGADKQAAYFKLPHEENPALGMRAIRICLTNKALFKTQLRAIYRASAHGNVAIMFPMIASASELRQAKAVAAEVRRQLEAEKTAFNPKTPIGIMVETPASAIISDVLAKEADFFSIGSNDLTQYTLAVDRQNESVNQFCDTHHEALLRLIKTTVDNGHREGIPVGLCGTLGADLTLTQVLVDMGLDELSVEPSLILKLRSRIAEG